MRWLIAHRWYIFQGSIILGVAGGLINSFGLHYWKQFGLIGVVVALWVSVVINSIYRLKDLSKIGREYFRTWIRDSGGNHQTKLNFTKSIELS
jgi:hypothetical protein